MRSLKLHLLSHRHLLALFTIAIAPAVVSQAQAPSGFGGSGGLNLAYPSTPSSFVNSYSTSSSLAPLEPVAEPAVAGAELAIVTRPVPPLVLERPMRYGGIHEFSVTAGLAESSGSILGYRQNVHTELLNLRYSRVIKNGRHFTASYSPEITPYIKLDQPEIDASDNVVPGGRQHSSGGGVTPMGFTFDYRPSHKIQPFYRCNYGVLYFRDRVLSQQGSQFMHTVDFGFGVHIYSTPLVSTTVGFRYIHMSNANIAEHNPGTDAETFYIGFSKFHSRKSRNLVY